jgi:hypothetical protein
MAPSPPKDNYDKAAETIARLLGAEPTPKQSLPETQNIKPPPQASAQRAKFNRKDWRLEVTPDTDVLKIEAINELNGERLGFTISMQIAVQLNSPKLLSTLIFLMIEQVLDTGMADINKTMFTVLPDKKCGDCNEAGWIKQAFNWVVCPYCNNHSAKPKPDATINIPNYSVR